MKSFFRNTELLATLLLMVACATVRPVPTENTNVQLIIRDSVVIHNDTVRIDVPVERYVDVVRQYDTLRLETSIAKSEAYVDTLTHTLKGKLEHKPTALKTEIKYVDRIVTEYRDSVVTKEIPVEVEVVRETVPKWSWYLLAINVLALIILAVRIYLKFIK